MILDFYKRSINIILETHWYFSWKHSRLRGLKMSLGNFKYKIVIGKFQNPGWKGMDSQICRDLYPWNYFMVYMML